MSFWRRTADGSTTICRLGGDVACCINAWTVPNSLWLGMDISGLVDWQVEHRLPDGGWNCEWIEGSTRSSFHSTLNSLKRLLAYDTATGGTEASRMAPGSSPVGTPDGSVRGRRSG